VGNGIVIITGDNIFSIAKVFNGIVVAKNKGDGSLKLLHFFQ
jgi:hypothetical protein